MDTYGRLHDNLRISVTDRCNIRCFYCMPETGSEYVDRAEILTFEEIERFVRIAVDLGVTKIRLTGGEPLVRKDLPLLVAALHKIPGVRDIAMTTNGVLLADQAQALYDAGLRRLNVHLDTLDRERFLKITRRDDFGRVMAGLDRAQALGFGPIKMNVVAVKNLIEPDIVPMARFGRERGIEIRYIEFMPRSPKSLGSLTSLADGHHARNAADGNRPAGAGSGPRPARPRDGVSFHRRHWWRRLYRLGVEAVLPQLQSPAAYLRWPAALLSIRH